jgi:hypothetical protein
MWMSNNQSFQKWLALFSKVVENEWWFSCKA